jgi:hypothetical protein
MRPRLALRCAAAVLAVSAAAACRPAATTTTPPDPDAPVVWYTGDALAARAISTGPGQGSRTGSDASSRPASPAERVARVDVLLDLLDAARFADDPGARDQLWQDLGGTARGRGPEATRDATSRVLGEAISLDAGLDAGPLSDDARAFLGAVITLLSADLGLVGAADDLAIRTAAYRDIAQNGHPRAADNARWRLYDHVHGCLQGAVTAPQERRSDVAVHALYVREDSLAPWLDDRAVHAQRPLPGADELLALMIAPRDQLAADPRWTTTVQRRSAGDTSLTRTLRESFPAPRDPNWPLATMPQGTGRRDALLPIVRIDDRRVDIDLGRPQVVQAERGAPELTRAVEAALARDGRGAVLLVAAPLLPSPALNSITRTLLDARVARVELAIREPRVALPTTATTPTASTPADPGHVVVQLPLELLREADKGPAAVLLRGARVHLHLAGRGAQIALDGRWLPGDPDLAAQLARIRKAYPRERMITIQLGDDVLYQQLLDLLRALVGGPQRSFEVAAWRAAAAPPPATIPAKSLTAEARRLERRAELGRDGARVSLQQAFPLAAGDQARLEILARSMLRCLPELETPLPQTDPLRLDLRFDEGRLARLTALKPRTRVAPERLAAVQACAELEARGFRLREHRDAINLELELYPAK